jgi:hypothetical protein
MDIVLSLVGRRLHNFEFAQINPRMSKHPLLLLSAGPAIPLIQMTR